MIEREPITVILSQRGWIRAMKGHVEPAEAGGAEVQGRRRRSPSLFHAQTTDKLLLAAADGRFYTLAADKLPGGRGFGEPVKLMVDIEGEGNVVALLRARRGGEAAARLVGRARLRHAGGGRGRRDAQGQAGRQPAPRRAAAGRAADRRPTTIMSRSIGENRKLVVFPLAELPEMGRGQGVQLQRYRDGGLSDATTLHASPRACRWAMGGESGRTRTETDMNPWRTARGAAGRMPPHRLPARQSRSAERERGNGYRVAGHFSTMR